MTRMTRMTRIFGKSFLPQALDINIGTMELEKPSMNIRVIRVICG